MYRRANNNDLRTIEQPNVFSLSGLLFLGSPTDLEWKGIAVESYPIKKKTASFHLHTCANLEIVFQQKKGFSDRSCSYVSPQDAVTIENRRIPCLHRFCRNIFEKLQIL